MDAKKLIENFQATTKLQLKLAEKLYTGQNYISNLKASYERLVGVVVWRYESLDAVIYVHDSGTFGFKAIKFYNDGIDYRVGSYQESEKLALNEAIHVL